MDHRQSHLPDLEYVKYAMVLAMINVIVHYVTQIQGAKVERRPTVAYWAKSNGGAMFGLTRTSH